MKTHTDMGLEKEVSHVVQISCCVKEGEVGVSYQVA